MRRLWRLEYRIRVLDGWRWCADYASVESAKAGASCYGTFKREWRIRNRDTGEIIMIGKVP